MTNPPPDSVVPFPRTRVFTHALLRRRTAVDGTPGDEPTQTPAVTPVSVAPTLTIAGATARLARSDVFTTLTGHGLERSDHAAEPSHRRVGRVGDAADVRERLRDRGRERRDLLVDLIERSVQTA